MREGAPAALGSLLSTKKLKTKSYKKRKPFTVKESSFALGVVCLICYLFTTLIYSLWVFVMCKKIFKSKSSLLGRATL